jgi:hypothetical protein
MVYVINWRRSSRIQSLAQEYPFLSIWNCVPDRFGASCTLADHPFKANYCWPE